jgi:hypothetical protein
LVAVVGTPLPRRAFGTYGVYVVCIDAEGCRGGGTGEPLCTDKLEPGIVGVDGGEVIERLDTDDDGDGIDDELALGEPVGCMDIEVGTTSG